MANDDHLKVKRIVQKLTNGDRKWICQRRLAHKEEKFADMQKAFKLERNHEIELKSGTVSGILKQSDKWLSIADGQEDGTRTRSSKEPELEAALFAWRAEQLQKDEKVRDEDLRYKAREIAAAMGINTDKGKGLSFSSGWLDRFKKRNSIKQTRYNRHGKKEDKGDEQTMVSYGQMPMNAMSQDVAASGTYDGTAAMSLHGGHPYLPAHHQALLPSSVNHNGGIPPVAHVAAVAQPASVPLPQDHTSHDAAIPQPPSGPSPNVGANIINSGNQYTSVNVSCNVYQQLMPQPGHVQQGESVANGSLAPGVPPVPQGIPMANQGIPQPGYVDPGAQIPSQVHHAFVPQPPVMTLQDPNYQHTTEGVPVPPSTGIPLPHQEPHLKVEDPDIANIPPPADIPDDH